METTWLVPWWWLIPAAMGGGIAGLLAIGMMDAGRE